MCVCVKPKFRLKISVCVYEYALRVGGIFQEIDGTILC